MLVVESNGSILIRTIVKHENNFLESLEEVDVVVTKLLNLVDKVDLNFLRLSELAKHGTVLLELGLGYIS